MVFHKEGQVTTETGESVVGEMKRLKRKMMKQILRKMIDLVVGHVQDLDAGVGEDISADEADEVVVDSEMLQRREPGQTVQTGDLIVTQIKNLELWETVIITSKISHGSKLIVRQVKMS